MFKDVGNEIKNIAETRVILSMILAVLIAIAIVIVFAYIGLKWMIIGIVLGVAIVGLTYFFARMNVIMMYGYGELIDQVKAIRQHITPQNASLLVEPIPEPDPDIIVESGTDSTPLSVRNTDGSWKCVFCEHLNNADAKWCYKCGVKAKFE